MEEQTTKQDANNRVGSSETPAGATADSPTGTVSPPEGTSTMLDTALEMAGVAEREGQGTEEGDVHEVDTTPAEASPDGKEEAPVDTETEAGEAGKGESAGEEPENVPFHEHPRWKEINKERDELRQYREQTQPLVEAQSATIEYCQENGITPEMYSQMLEIAAALQNDPERARELLTPLWQKVGGLADNQLPEDLLKKVSEGKMDEESAFELARLRGARQASTEAQKRNAARRVEADLRRSISSWETDKRQKDPDFKPKGNGEPDGKFELVQAKAMQLMQNAPVKSISEIPALLERAYNEVNQTFARFVPRPSKTEKHLPTSGASRNAKPIPKTPLDLAFAVVDGRLKV